MKFVFNYLLLILLMLVGGCGGKSIVLTRSQLLMGHVPVTIQIRTQSSQQEVALMASEGAYGEARRLEGLLSEWQEASEISCLNRGAGKVPCPISLETLQVLQRAEELSKKTKGAFDIRFASPTQAGRQGGVQLNPQGPEGFLLHPQTRIGLGAIGKGFIVDTMSSYLASQGFPDHLISGGGDLVAQGSDWEVGIQIPEKSPGQFVGKQKLSNRAVATSGIYEQGAHLSDPRSGKSVQRPGSITVIADDLTTADALATGLYILGEADTQVILKNFPGVQVIWSDQAGNLKNYP